MIKVGDLISPIVGRVGWKGGPNEGLWDTTTILADSPLLVIEILSGSRSTPLWLRVICSKGPLWFVYTPSAFYHD